MNYDQLIRQINELENGNQEIGSICFPQQRGILHQERSCEKCETDMHVYSTRDLCLEMQE